MSHKERPSRRTFLASAAVAATTLPLAGACAQQFPANKAGNTVEPGPGFQMDLWCLPRVQFWSFDNKDPLMRALGLAFSVQVFTTGADEKTYSLTPAACS